jgi:hypothetical protein
MKLTSSTKSVSPLWSTCAKRKDCSMYEKERNDNESYQVRGVGPHVPPLLQLNRQSAKN